MREPTLARPKGMRGQQTPVSFQRVLRSSVPHNKILKDRRFSPRTLPLADRGYRQVKDRAGLKT